MSVLQFCNVTVHSQIATYIVTASHNYQQIFMALKTPD